MSIKATPFNPENHVGHVQSSVDTPPYPPHLDASSHSTGGANRFRSPRPAHPRHENLIGADEGWEAVLAGDVAYEKDLAEAVTDWLAGLARRGATVLVGDPRRAYLALGRLESVIEYRVPVTRELEDSEIKRTGVFRFRG